MGARSGWERRTLACSFHACPALEQEDSHSRSCGSSCKVTESTSTPRERATGISSTQSRQRVAVKLDTSSSVKVSSWTTSDPWTMCMSMRGVCRCGFSRKETSVTTTSAWISLKVRRSAGLEATMRMEEREGEEEEEEEGGGEEDDDEDDDEDNEDDEGRIQERSNSA